MFNYIYIFGKDVSFIEVPSTYKIRFVIIPTSSGISLIVSIIEPYFMIRGLIGHSRRHSKWDSGDELNSVVKEGGDVYLQNLTKCEEVFLFSIENNSTSVTQDTLILTRDSQYFNFEILDLGSFSFSNKAPMIKTYKIGNYNYMLNNITYNDGSTYLGLVRYDITDGKCHVFHLGRDFLSGFPNYTKETMYISNNMFYVTTTGEIVMLLQAPTGLIPQKSDICYFVFILTGTQIFYVGMHVTTKNADETFMIADSQVVFENGDATGYFDNSFDNYGEIIANGDIYWGDKGRVILDEAFKLSISDISLGSAQLPLVGLIGFANKFDDSRAEVYFYDNKVRFVIYKRIYAMYNSISFFSDNIYTVPLDDNNVTTGGLHLSNCKALVEWDYEGLTPLNRVGFSFFGSGKDVSYIRLLNWAIHEPGSEAWEVSGNYVTYLPSIFNNALYCSNTYEHYLDSWLYGEGFQYKPSFYVLTADFKFYHIYQNVNHTYSYIANLSSPSYYEPIDIIDMPSSLKHFGGVFVALGPYEGRVQSYFLFVVDPATGYPCLIDVDMYSNNMVEILNQEPTFQNPKLISQSQVAFKKYGIYPTLGILFYNKYPLFIVGSDGYVWARGKNDYGQLGLGDTTDRTTFSKLGCQFNNPPIKILSYRTCTYFIYENGDIYCAGRNVHGHFNLVEQNSSEIVSTPLKSYYNYADYKQIIFSEERITAVNKRGEFTYSGIDFPYELYIDLRGL